MLTQDVHADAIIAYKDGATHREACDHIGIGFSTLEGWNRQGEADLEDNLDTIYSRFRSDVKKARAVVAKKRRTKIENDESWQSAAWLLERTRPLEYGRNAEELRQSKLLEEKIEALQSIIEQKLSNETNCT